MAPILHTHTHTKNGLTGQIQNVDSLKNLVSPTVWKTSPWLAIQQALKRSSVYNNRNTFLDLKENIEFIKKSANIIYDLKILTLTEGVKNPSTYLQDIGNAPLAPIISLTTIASRLAHLEKVFLSIQQQTLPYHSLNLYLSREPYLLDEGVAPDSAILQRFKELGVNIYFCPNIGSYRKIVPILKQLRLANAPYETPIVTIDDDTYYPPNFLADLMHIAYQHDFVVAHRGRQMTLKNNFYALYKNFIAPTRQVSLFNLANGRNGIVYKLKYFPQEAEYFVGPFLASTADDIWCKFITTLYCIPTYIQELQAAFDVKKDFSSVDSKNRKTLFFEYNTKNLNDEAFSNLETYFAQIQTSVLNILRGCHNE